MSDTMADSIPMQHPPVRDVTTAGMMLRNARESRGLHIAALAVAIKVPVKKIEALEADRHELLPDMVFVRALAASICRTLEVDATTILERLPQTIAPKLSTQDDAINAPFRAPGSEPATKLPNLLKNPATVVVAGVALATALVLYLPRDMSSDSKAVATNAASASSDKSASAAPFGLAGTQSSDAEFKPSSVNMPEQAQVQMQTQAPLQAQLQAPRPSQVGQAPTATYPNIVYPGTTKPDANSAATNTAAANTAAVNTAAVNTTTGATPNSATPNSPATTVASLSPTTAPVSKSVTTPAAGSIAAPSATPTPPAAVPANSAPAAGMSANAQTTTPANGILVIKFKNPSWVEVLDAKGVAQVRGIFNAGEVSSVSGQLPLSVVVGRADATEITVRGQPYSLNGIAKENVARFKVP